MGQAVLIHGQLGMDILLMYTQDTAMIQFVLLTFMPMLCALRISSGKRFVVISWSVYLVT